MSEVPLYVVRGLDMSDTSRRKQEEEHARGKLEEARMAEQVHSPCALHLARKVQSRYHF